MSETRRSSLSSLSDPIVLLFVLSLAGGLFLLVTGSIAERVVGFLFIVNAAAWLADRRRSVSKALRPNREGDAP
jgi:hypothetical protein